MSQVMSTDRNRFKEYWVRQAIQCAARQRWAEAEKINRSIVRQCPDDVDARNRLGKAQWELGLLPEAKESYRQALALDPGNAIAARNLLRLETAFDADCASGHEDATPRVPADIFIAESGKTTIVKVLPLPGKQGDVLALPGAPLRLEMQGRSMRVLNRGGQPLGQLGAALAQRLAALMEAGNRYAAAVVGIQQGDVYIVIKETYQHASQVGRHSFPNQSRAQSLRLARLRQSAVDLGSETLAGNPESGDWADVESDLVELEDVPIGEGEI